MRCKSSVIRGHPEQSLFCAQVEQNFQMLIYAVISECNKYWSYSENRRIYINFCNIFLQEQQKLYTNIDLVSQKLFEGKCKKVSNEKLKQKMRKNIY